MQRSCLELEETRRVKSTRVQRSCLELEGEDKKCCGNKDAEQLLRVRKDKKS